MSDPATGHALPHDWLRIKGLIERHYRDWAVSNGPVAEGLGVIAPGNAPLPAPGHYTLRLRLYAPAALLGSRDSSFGITQPDLPAGLWPLQLSMLVCLRLRMFGWRTLLRWPDEITLDGVTVGRTLCLPGAQGMAVEVDIAVTEFRGAQSPSLGEELLYREVPLETGLEGFRLSMTQGLVQVLESPWPVPRMIKLYEDWCATLGTKVALPHIEGHAAAGIACAVLPTGDLKVEMLGGRCVTLCCPIKDPAP